MATTTYGSPYVASSDLVSGYPTVSSSLATRIDEVSYKGNGVNAITSAGYTLVLTDAGKLVTVSNASAQNLTIPLNSSVAFPTGTKIDVLNIGAGTWTVTATGGVTLNGSTNVPTNGRVRLTKTGTDTWYSSPFGGGGLTVVASTSFSAAASVSVNSCFTAAYDNYRIVLYASAAAGTPSVSIRMRASSTDDTSANYASQLLAAGSTTVTGLRATGGTSARIVDVTTTPGTVTSIDIYRPAIAVATAYVSQGVLISTAPEVDIWAGWHNVSTAYDGFTLIPGSSTLTGTLRVYGYSNS